MDLSRNLDIQVVKRELMGEQERRTQESKISLSRLKNFCRERPVACAFASGMGGVFLALLIFMLSFRIFGEYAYIGVSILLGIVSVCIIIIMGSGKRNKLKAILILAVLVAALIIGTYYLRFNPEEPMQKTLTVWDHSLEDGTCTVTLRNYDDTDIFMKEEYKNDTLVGVLHVVVEAHSCKKFTLQATYAPGDKVTLTTENGTVLEFTIGYSPV